MEDLNILILSAGTRNKVVQAFRKELTGRGRVIATDASSLAPAIYDADAAYIVPRIDAPDYLDRILEICRREKIRGMFSLIDPELSLIAQNRKRFEDIGVTVIVSSYELCELSLHKMRMYRRLQEMGVSTAQCWMDQAAFLGAVQTGKAAFPVFVKPEGGSASIHISRVESAGMLQALLEAEPDLMIQQYMSGQEYGCDVYVDLISGKVTSLFVKKKIKMRAGETDKSISVRDERLFDRIVSVVEALGYRGMIDIDLFHEEEKEEDDLVHNPEGQWYLSEVNPRFGGGYPHAYAAGVNFPASVIRNLEGEENPVTIGEYRSGICMMKYNDMTILDQGELIH